MIEAVMEEDRQKNLAAIEKKDKRLQAAETKKIALERIKLEEDAADGDAQQDSAEDRRPERGRYQWADTIIVKTP